ncbi:hypothetical protein Nmel_002553, partial [Mimus melanotis]
HKKKISLTRKDQTGVWEVKHVPRVDLEETTWKGCNRTPIPHPTRSMLPLVQAEKQIASCKRSAHKMSACFFHRQNPSSRPDVITQRTW